MLLSNSRPIALGTLLLALAGHASSLLAQGPTSFQITTNDGGMTVYGYANETERILAKTSTGDLVWFDAGTTGAPGLMWTGSGIPSLTTGILNAVWRRGPGLPSEAFVARNFFNTVIVPVPGLYRMFTSGPGFLPASSSLPQQIVQDQLSTNINDRWTLDAVHSANNIFYLREEEPGFSTWGVYRKEPGQYLTFPNARRLTSTQANGPLSLSPDDARVAFQSGNTIAFCNATNPPATPLAATTFALPAGKVLSQASWIDGQRLVAIMGTVVGGSGQLVLLDRLQAGSPSQIRELTPTNAFGVPTPQCTSPSVSGNGRWVTFAISQNVGGTAELCPAVMNLRDANTGTAPAPALPGGGFVVLTPLESWTALNSLRVQQRNVNGGESARVLFRGRAPGGTTSMLYTTGLERDFTIAGRVTAAGATLNFRSIAGPQDVIVGLVASLFRQSTPGQLIGTANGDTVAIFTSLCTPGTAFSQQVVATPTTATLGFPFYYQSAWLNGVDSSISLSRVTELPLFN